VLADPHAALSVTSAATLPGVSGTCFSVEPTTVSIAPPIDPGIFCYGDDGMPTGVRTRFGTLALSGSARTGTRHGGPGRPGEQRPTPEHERPTGSPIALAVKIALILQLWCQDLS
jgi:hypothetical protein